MKSQFRKCKTCGRIFQSSVGTECPDCIEDREQKFNLVKEYLYEKPGASLEEIAEVTGVDSKLVIRFLREGRLEMSGAAAILVCEKCGAPVTSGTMCDKCKDKLARAMQSVLPSSYASNSAKQSLPSTSGKGNLHVNVRGR